MVVPMNLMKWRTLPPIDGSCAYKGDSIFSQVIFTLALVKGYEGFIICAHHFYVLTFFRIPASDAILGGPDKSKGNIVFRGSAFVPLLASNVIKVPIDTTACT